jgi:hypothetical protein
MVRTQIQLTEAQARDLKRVTVANGISMAEAIRQALDAYLGRQAGRGGDRKRELALQACGRFTAGARLATEHDAAFAEGDVP